MLNFDSKRVLKLTTLSLACLSWSKPLKAMETKFLSGGGLQYTLSAQDFRYSMIKDDRGFSYVNSQTGEIDPSLAIFSTDAKPSSETRRSAEMYASALQVTTSTDNREMLAVTYAQNISYWMKHPSEYFIAAAMPEIYISGGGRVVVDVTYRVNGLVANLTQNGDFNVYNSLNAFVIDPVLYGADSTTTEPVISNMLHQQPKIGDLPRNAVEETNFYRAYRFDEKQSRSTRILTFDTSAGGYKLGMSLKNKVPGVGFVIEKIEVTFTPPI